MHTSSRSIYVILTIVTVLQVSSAQESYTDTVAIPGMDKDNSGESLIVDTVIVPESAGIPDPDTVTFDSVPEDILKDQSTSSVSITPAVTRQSATISRDISEPVVSSLSDTGELQSLDNMVVTATRTRRRMSETPASVTVISRKEIECAPAKDINDLVANKTGVQVRRVVGMGEGVPSDISMRGIPGALAAARTLILVDGIPTNASGTPFLILNEIPVEIIENVEIVRGPYSSLYGANAFGGVVNVITKKGDGKPLFAGMFESSYPFSTLETWLDGAHIDDAAKTGARQALWNGDVLSSGGNERMHYLINAGYRTIGNYLMNDSVLVKTPDTSYYIPTTNHDYTDLRLLGKIGYRVSERVAIDVHARYFKSDLGYGVTRYSPDTVDVDIDGEKIIVGPQISFNVSDRVDIKAGGYLRFVSGAYMNEMDKRIIKWKSTTHDWQADFQTIIRPVEGHVVTAGSEFLSNAITFGDLIDLATDLMIINGNDERISNAGVYIQDEIIINNRYRIVPGIRMDYHTVFGTAWSPKLGILVPLYQQLRFRCSAGRAFRAPNHAELSMPPLPLKDTIPLVSNPDLKPEYIWAFDGGFDFTPFPDIKLQCGGFYNDMQDLIGQGIMLDKKTLDVFVTHENISSAWSAGSELECIWRLTPELTISGGYVFQMSKNESASTTAAYFRKNGIGRVKDTIIELDYIPNHRGNIGIIYTKDVGKVRLSFMVDQMIVGERNYLNFLQIDPDKGDINFDLSNLTAEVAPPYQKLPAYCRTDLMLRAETGRFFGAIAVQNCFDIDYEESFGTLAPGLMATIKLGAQL